MQSSPKPENRKSVVSFWLATFLIIFPLADNITLPGDIFITGPQNPLLSAKQSSNRRSPRGSRISRKTRSDSKRASNAHALTAVEIIKTYRKAVRQKILIPTYDPFLDILGVLAWGYNKDKRELYLTQPVFRRLFKHMQKNTLFKPFLDRFKRITLSPDKTIITEMKTKYVSLEIPKAFGCKMEIHSGFKLKVWREPGNKTIVKVMTPRKIHFRLHGSLVSKMKGVVSMDVRRLILTPNKNMVGASELIAYIDGYVPVWPQGKGVRGKPDRYRKYRVQVNLSTLGTLTGASFVWGYDL